MASPAMTLFGLNLKTWLSAKGFWLVVAAALVPLAFTGAWVATHVDDVAATSVTADRVPTVEGEVVNFTATFKNVGSNAVGPFNVTLDLKRFTITNVDESGRATADFLSSRGKLERKEIEGLAPGEERTVSMTWNALPGVFVLFATADSSDDVQEIEEYNNVKQFDAGNSAGAGSAFTVNFKAPDEAAAPEAQQDLGGRGNATADLVTTLDWRVIPFPGEPARSGGAIHPQDQVEITATFENKGPSTVENATLVLRMGDVFQGEVVPVSGFRFFGPAIARSTLSERQADVTLAPGQTTTVKLNVLAEEGSRWVEAFADPTTSATDANAADNHAARAIVVTPLIPPGEVLDQYQEGLKPFLEPEPEATLREFYKDVLGQLYLRMLVPFIALFYAGGVLLQEREQGTLTYLLTRPVPRGLIPLTRFLASFVVSAIAITIGLAAAFLLLFGTPAGDLGFLTTPLLVTLIALFVYGAVFTLLGVWVKRPYLWGVGIVLGWETAAGFLIPFVANFTVSHHLGTLLDTWQLDQGFQALPTGDGMRALFLLLAGAVVALIAASGIMKKREFDV